MIRLFLCFIIVVGLTSFSATGQDLNIEAQFGAGVCFASKKNTKSSFSPIVSPNAAVLLYKAINSKLSLKSGFIYQLKSIKTTNQIIFDSSYTQLMVDGTTQHHYLSIPIQVVYSFKKQEKITWRIAAGFNYGFLLYARSKGMMNSYYNTQLLDKQDYNYENYVGLTPSRARNRSSDRSELFGFTPAVRLDVDHYFHKRFFLRAFYEYNLNDVSSNPGSSKVFLHYSGIAVGCSF